MAGADPFAEITVEEVLLDAPLAAADEVAAWPIEGPGVLSFPLGRMRFESTGDPDDGQMANTVVWCDKEWPDHIRVSWDFYPLREPGLAILFFAAVGHGGRSVLDPSLAQRTGPYEQYMRGDIDALHVSYFRRRLPKEIRFHTSNLRKSHGFHLVCQGADPIPTIHQVDPPYRISLVKSGPWVRFAIDDLELWRWCDDGETYGPILTGGHIGFRQMAPFIAEYANLLIERITPLA